MNLRPLLRPLPLFLVFVFAAVAVVDLVQTLREEEPPPPVVLRPEAVRFQPREPVLDFSATPREAGVTILPVPAYSGELWSEPGEFGTWMLGHGAELEFDLIRGGQPFLVFEGRPAEGKRPVRRVRIFVNGVDCGMTNLRGGWQRWNLGVPAGTLKSGSNSIVFRLPDRAQVRKPRRALLLRRIRLGFDSTPGFREDNADPLSVDFDAQKVVIAAPGVFEARFAIDDRIDALRLKYRLRGPESTGELTVARPPGVGPGTDPEIRRVLSSSAEGLDRVRVPLHGRRGDFVLRLSAESRGDRFQLDVRSLELVTERNRSGNRSGRLG